MQRYFCRLMYLPVCVLFNMLNNCLAQTQSAAPAPVRIAVAGISHGHASWILNGNKPDVVVTGIYEADNSLALQYARQYKFSTKLIYNNLGKMLDAVKPAAVVAFGSVYDHLAVVEACAPRGIHVMVEKPLAATLQQALRMDSLAKKYHIQLLTNFETSWYPSTVKTYQLVHDSNFAGSIKKVVIHDGHEGPKEIGVSKEFLDWLTDPVQNGGGALMDFGCYGANLMTYLMNGQQPLSVTAVTQQFKPGVYPRVEDEASVIVTYPAAQCIIQASWNWPFSRKDMEVYGTKGYIIAVNGSHMRLRGQNEPAEHQRQVTAKEVAVYEDPFSYLADVVRNKIKVPQNGVYSLPTNITVMRILEAAKESAKKGQTIYLDKW